MKRCTAQKLCIDINYMRNDVCAQSWRLRKKSVNVYPFSERVSPAVCFSDKKQNKIMTIKYLLGTKTKEEVTRALLYYTIIIHAVYIQSVTSL